MDSTFVSFADFVHAEDLLVGPVRTEGHFLGIVHTFDGPVIQFGITTRLFEIG